MLHPGTYDLLSDMVANCQTDHVLTAHASWVATDTAIESTECALQTRQTREQLLMYEDDEKADQCLESAPDSTATGEGAVEVWQQMVAHAAVLAVVPPVNVDSLTAVRLKPSDGDTSFHSVWVNQVVLLQYVSKLYVSKLYLSSRYMKRDQKPYRF